MSMNNHFLDTAYAVTSTGQRISFEGPRTAQRIIINTTERFNEVRHYLDWYCDRYGGYYDLPLYGPVFIQDRFGNKCETAWFVQPDISGYTQPETLQSPTVNFEELYGSQRND